MYLGVRWNFMNVENMLDITSASKSLIFYFSRELSANAM